MDKVITSLASSGASFQFEAIPPHVVHEAKRRIIDTLGCAMGAFQEETCQIGVKLARTAAGDTLGATVLGTAHRTWPPLAAFANGMMARYLDYNDQYSGETTGHPSDTLAAVLASSDALHRDGQTVITATVLAYEVFGRLCDAADIMGLWDHTTFGAIASAVGAARALELSAEQMAQAIAIATVTCPDLGQTRKGELSMWKGAAFPNAAQNGVFAALLAREGMTGPPNAFEGPQGLCQAVAGPLDVQLFGGPEPAFKLTETAIKYHSACYFGLSAIEAVRALRSALPVGEEVRAIRVSTYDRGVQMCADTEAKWNPHTRETADHSIPYVVAVALLHGTVEPGHYTPECMRDPQIGQLMQRVEVTEDPEYSRQFPARQTTRVEVETAGGTRVAREAPFPLGHPQNPVSDAQVEDKFRRLTREVLSHQQTDTFLDRLWHLEDLQDVGEVFPLVAL